MQCDEFEARLQKLLDLRRAPQRDPRLCGHAHVCPHCAGQLAATARLLKGLDLWDAPPLADDFALRVVQQVAPLPQHQHQHTRWHSLVLVVAATLLIGVIPGVAYLLKSRSPSNPDQSSPPSARFDKLAYSTPHAPTGSAPDLDDSPWTRYSNSILGLYPEQTRERHRQRVSEFAEDLRPIASPFNAALTAIRRTIPVNRSANKNPPNASISPGTASSSPSHA